MKALAIFQDSPDQWRLQEIWLKPGFRHVLVAIEVTGIVVVLDPANGGLHPWADDCELEAVAEHYRGIGATVVPVDAIPGGPIYPTRWTCVEVVKRVLGVRGLFVLTPYQLYRELTCLTR